MLSKIITYFFFLYFTCLVCEPDSIRAASSADSLIEQLQLINKLPQTLENDTTRISLLHKIGWEMFTKGEYPSASQYANELLAFAKNISSRNQVFNYIRRKYSN